VKGANILGMPAIVTEQVPDKLGATVPELKEHLAPNTPIVPKTLFSMITPEVNRWLSEEQKQVKQVSSWFAAIATAAPNISAAAAPPLAIPAAAAPSTAVTTTSQQQACQLYTTILGPLKPLVSCQQPPLDFAALTTHQVPIYFVVATPLMAKIGIIS
jgi:hypothetical protein